MIVTGDVGAEFVGVAEVVAKEFDDGVFKVVFGEWHGVFPGDCSLLQGLLKYDIVDWRGDKSFEWQSIARIIIV